jgi:hypothetical protein
VQFAISFKLERVARLLVIEFDGESTIYCFPHGVFVNSCGLKVNNETMAAKDSNQEISSCGHGFPRESGKFASYVLGFSFTLSRL